VHTASSEHTEQVLANPPSYDPVRAAPYLSPDSNRECPKAAELQSAERPHRSRQAWCD